MSRSEINEDPARRSKTDSDVTACIEAEGREIVANLSDGRQLRAYQADMIAEQLWNAGCRADGVTMPDWRKGDIALGTQQQIVIRSYMRWREQGKSHEESIAPWSVLYEDEPGSTAEHQDIPTPRPG